MGEGSLLFGLLQIIITLLIGVVSILKQTAMNNFLNILT